MEYRIIELDKHEEKFKSEIIHYNFQRSQL